MNSERISVPETGDTSEGDRVDGISLFFVYKYNKVPVNINQKSFARI